ncbi:Rha family transcriptional regulator [Maridesulfovibrio sp.]|uniref:Rha family transcriptional regulator n=1 Tax=Maridesulfovibrio sp. TaxID=2795000 RepID=UPI0029F56C8E|nr:Rha family transcriptional regulator [Maridesulfovibrio sp.]
MADITPILSIEKGRPIVSSLSIAEHFGKRHDNIIRDIAKLEIPDNFRLLNFEESSYINGQNKHQPAYNLTRDGFTILVMGFTGKAAMKWKIRYIEAFNAMEKQLLEPQQLSPTTPASFEQHKELFPLITEWCILLKDKDIWQPQEVFHQAVAAMQVAIGKPKATPINTLTAIEIEYAREYLNAQIAILKDTTPVLSLEDQEAARLRSERARKAARARWDRSKR